MKCAHEIFLICVFLVYGLLKVHLQTNKLTFPIKNSIWSLFFIVLTVVGLLIKILLESDYYYQIVMVFWMMVMSAYLNILVYSGYGSWTTQCSDQPSCCCSRHSTSGNVCCFPTSMGPNRFSTIFQVSHYLWEH